MPLVSIEKHGIVGCNALVESLIVDMLANGFTQTYPTTPHLGLVAGQTPAPQVCVMEAGVKVDQLAATQPWRIRIESKSDYQIQVNVGTVVQLGGQGATWDGKAPILQGANTGTAGEIGNGNVSNGRHFVHRDVPQGISSAALSASYPLSYRITFAPHGIALFIWSEATDNVGNQFSWMCIQRAVDAGTGKPNAVGKSPVFCVYSYLNGVKKMIVREADIYKPTISWDADKNVEDSRAIINTENQVAITEDNKYIITFPNGLNTPRCAYTHELDLIATTSADVVSEWADIPLTVYGMPSARTYKAMGANKSNNTGMRLLMLMNGPVWETQDQAPAAPAAPAG